MKENYDFSKAKRGAVAPSKGKTRITIMLDDDVLQAARARADEQGIGYQTLINSTLKTALCTQPAIRQDSPQEPDLVVFIEKMQGYLHHEMKHFQAGVKTSLRTEIHEAIEHLIPHGHALIVPAPPYPTSEAFGKFTVMLEEHSETTAYRPKPKAKTKSGQPKIGR